MNKTVILLVISILTFASPLFAKNMNLEKMDDMLARGYLAASENKIDTAIDCFTKSLYYASKAGNWRGLIDAGNAFSAIGEPKKALGPFKNAYKIAASQKDWRGLVAISYSYAGLPENLQVKNIALSALDKAVKIASSNKDWRGLMEIAKAFSKLDKKDKAKEILGSAIKIVETLKLGSAAITIAEAARETDNMDLYNECMHMARTFGDYEKKHSTPPPGWQGYGESVAGPKEISIDAQIAMRESADRDIISKNKYLEEVRKKEEKATNYYVIYKKYYDYPYYYMHYGYWHELNNYQICSWARYCLSRYKLENGIYVYLY